MIKTIAICLIVLFALGCEKESNMDTPFSSIKLLDTKTDYLARSIVSLPDGSVITGSVAFEDQSGGAPYGLNPSVMAKYNPQGTLEWLIDLPKEVYELWKCILLDNGNILAVGFDDTPYSKNLGAAIISKEGEELHVQSIYNSVDDDLVSTGNNRASIDAIQRQDGHILLVMSHQSGTGAGADTPRLIVLSRELSMIQDIVYDNPESTGGRSLRQLTIREGLNEELFLSGTIYRGGLFMGIITLNSELDTIASSVFNSPSTSFYDNLQNRYRTRSEVASNIAIDENGYPVFVASLRNPSDSIYEPNFNLRDQEIFMRSPQFGLWNITSEDTDTPVKQIAGFPGNAIIQKMKSTTDGGFIMVGTCGINNNQSIPSQYKLLVVKMDRALNVEWMAYPQMQFATLGADVSEASGEYLIAATQHSLGEVNKPFFLRLNQSGVIK